MFNQHAPHYWAANLPAMPLRPRSKMPALNSWQAYGMAMPTDEERARWLEFYADGNIGMPLGPCSGIVGLDIDSEDPRVQKILDQVLPPSPWKRIGKKGYVAAFKYNGERTYRIKDSDGNTILELLSKGAQIVLPPSIHPDTQAPYESNSNLYEVLDQLVPLPANFEATIRQALIDAGFKLTSRGANKVTEWVPAGGRDSAMTSMAGLLARGVIRAERTLSEALAELDVWIASFTENVSGDPLDPAKGKQKILEFIRRDLVEAGKVLPKGWDAGLPSADIKQALAYFGEDVEAWTYEEVMEFLTKSFIEIPKDDVAGRARIIDDVLMRIAKTDTLSALETDMIIQFIVHGNGRTISVSAIRKRIVELRGRELVGNDHTEIAQALIRELERYGEVRFHNTCFWRWNGSHWAELPEPIILKDLAENFGSLQAARKHNDHKGILRTMAALVPNFIKSIDVPGINFANGYLTTDMELLNHDPKFGATYTLPYRYAPEAAAPLRFMAFLDQSWGDDPDYLDKIQALREMISATLFKIAPRFQKAFCLYGIPHSGKSVLMRIIRELIPTEAQCNVSPHDFADRFMPAQMVGKLLNFAGELSDTDLISGERFKLIVDGEEMSGQYKGKDIFKFHPLCAHWFASNHLPRTRDTSDGFNRRWLILQFNKPVPESEKITNLGEDIAADEREAIVAWALQTMPDLMRRQHYLVPRSHTELISEVASQNNNVRFFMATGPVQLTANDADVLTEAELYAAYYGFCKVQANSQPFQQKRFRLTMNELGRAMKVRVEIIRNGEKETAMYHGVALPGLKKKVAA